MIIILATFCQFARPYWDWRVSIQELFCCFSISINCVALLYYNSDEFSNPKEFSLEPDGASRLDSVLVAVNAITIAGIAALFAFTYIEARFKQYSARTVSRNIAASVVDLQTQLRAVADEFMERLTPHVTNTDAIPALAFHQAARETLESNGMSYVSAVIDATLLIMKHAHLPVNFLKIFSRDGTLDGIAKADVTKTLVRYCILFRISQFATSQELATGS